MIFFVILRSQLLIIAFCAANKDLFLSLNGINSMILAMKAHEQEHDVQKHASMALLNLTTEPSKIQTQAPVIGSELIANINLEHISAVLKEGCVEILVEVAKNLSKDYEVLTQIASVFKNVTSSSGMIANGLFETLFLN